MVTGGWTNPRMRRAAVLAAMTSVSAAAAACASPALLSTLFLVGAAEPWCFCGRGRELAEGEKVNDGSVAGGRARVGQDEDFVWLRAPPDSTQTRLEIWARFGSSRTKKRTAVRLRRRVEPWFLSNRIETKRNGRNGSARWSFPNSA